MVSLQGNSTQARTDSKQIMKWTEAQDASSTRIKDAGIASCHSRGYILSKLQGLEIGLREGTSCVQGQKNMLTRSKRHFFVIEKYVEDGKQKQRGVPDLVESIMRLTDPVKEELRRILFKMNQYRFKIIKIRVSTFRMSRKSTDSRWRPIQPFRLVRFKPITVFQTLKNHKK